MVTTKGGDMGEPSFEVLLNGLQERNGKPILYWGLYGLVKNNHACGVW